MPILNHVMLAVARESRGLTQQQLVDLVPNLNQGNYSKMEKGILKISDEVLIGISEALNYPVTFFYKKSVSTPVSSFYYRKRASTSKKVLSELEAKFDIFRMIVDDLLDSVEVPEFMMPQYKPGLNMRPEEAAARVREFLKLPKGPIKNLVQALEAAGIIIYFMKAGVEKFDGITLITDSGQPIIFINDSMPNDRKRFTIAHELGHLVMHIPFSSFLIGDEESEANLFASEFLMPQFECRAELKNLKFSNLTFLKSYWLVSKAAILYKAKQIGAITEGKYINMSIELSRSGERKMERDPIDIDSPRIIKLIIETHKDVLNYSKDELLSILSISNDDFDYFFKAESLEEKVKPKILKFEPRII